MTRIDSPPSFTINGMEYTVVQLGDLEIVAWRLLDRVVRVVSNLILKESFVSKYELTSNKKRSLCQYMFEFGSVVYVPLWSTVLCPFCM